MDRVRIFCLLVVLSFLFNFNIFADSDELEDNPFLDRREEKKYEDEAERVLEGVKLTAVLYSPKGSKAMIDGRIMKVGDVIDNKEIIKIKSEKVILKDYLGQEFLLEMDNILSTNESDTEDDGYE